jgi:hypothetical protein
MHLEIFCIVLYLVIFIQGKPWNHGYICYYSKQENRYHVLIFSAFLWEKDTIQYKLENGINFR